MFFKKKSDIRPSRMGKKAFNVRGTKQIRFREQLGSIAKRAAKESAHKIAETGKATFNKVTQVILQQIYLHMIGTTAGTAVGLSVGYFTTGPLCAALGLALVAGTLAPVVGVIGYAVGCSVTGVFGGILGNRIEQKIRKGKK
jgi:hypothetical protein